MTTQNEQTSAKILQFPARPAARRAIPAEADAPGRDGTAARSPQQTPQILYGSACYHQAAIDQENALRER